MTAPQPEQESGGNFFTRKLGPMPMWAWLAAGASGLLIISYLRNKQSAQNQAPSSLDSSQVPQFVNQTYTTVNPPEGSAPAPSPSPGSGGIPSSRVAKLVALIAKERSMLVNAETNLVKATSIDAKIHTGASKRNVQHWQNLVNVRNKTLAQYISQLQKLLASNSTVAVNPTTPHSPTPMVEGTLAPGMTASQWAAQQGLSPNYVQQDGPNVLSYAQPGLIPIPGVPPQ